MALLLWQADGLPARVKADVAPLTAMACKRHSQCSTALLGIKMLTCILLIQ